MREPGAAGCCGSGYWAWGGCSVRDEALRDGVWALGRAAAAGDGGTNVLICPVTALSLLGWGVAGSCAQWGAPWGWGLGLGQGHPCPSPARNGAVPSTVLIPSPLPQRLTFPLLSVTLLVSFGSSMLYGYNLAVVNSPAVVRDGAALLGAGHGGGTPAPCQNAGFALKLTPERAAQGQEQCVRDVGHWAGVTPWKAGLGKPPAAAPALRGSPKSSLNPTGTEAALPCISPEGLPSHLPHSPTTFGARVSLHPTAHKGFLQHHLVPALRARAGPRPPHPPLLPDRLHLRPGRAGGLLAGGAAGGTLRQVRGWRGTGGPKGLDRAGGAAPLPVLP